MFTLNVKFILVSGKVPSINDNDWYYINAYQLISLYNLPKEMCVLVENEDLSSLEDCDINPWQIVLRPLYSGSYKKYLQCIIKLWRKSYNEY